MDLLALFLGFWLILTIIFFAVGELRDYLHDRRQERERILRIGRLHDN